MSTTSTPSTAGPSEPPWSTVFGDRSVVHPFDERPAGERYYRHPGDVVRLVVWAVVTIAVVLFVQIATDTSAGVTTDLGRAGARAATAVRELVLALTQVAVVVTALGIVALLVVQRRWRRLGFVVLGAIAGAAIVTLLDQLLDVPGRLPDAVSSGTWLASTRFPNLAVVGAAAATATVGKPWLSRPWARATNVALLVLVVAMAVAGTAGVPPLLLAMAAGTTVGAAVLVAFGAPNRRPSPAAVAAALDGAGAPLRTLELQRAVGGRSQLYRATTEDGRRLFLKVFSQDSRDAELLYRGYRTLVLRGPNDDWPSSSLDDDVRREAFLLLLLGAAGVRTPRLEALATLSDGSIALAMNDVGGRPLDTLTVDEIDADLLDAVWRQVDLMARNRVAHRSLRAANILVAAGEPVVADVGFGHESASPRLLSIDRAELLASLAVLVGPTLAVASAARVLEPDDLAGAAAYLQPLALTAATRKRTSKALLRATRDEIVQVTHRDAEPLARLVRVRPKTLLTIAALTGAFYVLLPQLANVGDSFQALRSANLGWILACIACSGLTYVAGAFALRASVAEHLPVVPTVETQMASSFVNRVTPANVGGMALNVRFMQKAGVDPAEAVTGMGLNVVAGGIIHIVLLFVFFAWAGQSTGGFQVPGGSKLLAVLAILMAVVGIVIATRRGRRLAKQHLLGFLNRSRSSVVGIARSPARLAVLFGGSLGVTIAYIASLSAAVNAFPNDMSFAEVGAVYLGASLIAAAAPTPGGLGAMEAALVAGFTAIHMDPGTAVAAVLCYRLATYWLPILPGWLSFRRLEQHNMI